MPRPRTPSGWRGPGSSRSDPARTRASRRTRRRTRGARRGSSPRGLGRARAPRARSRRPPRPSRTRRDRRRTGARPDRVVVSPREARIAPKPAMPTRVWAPRSRRRHRVGPTEPDGVETVSDSHVRGRAGGPLRRSGPFVPSSIETQAAAMLGMICTIENGFARSGPRSTSTWMQFSNDLRPPIPVATAAPMRSGAAAMEIPVSASACVAAASASWEKRSIRRAPCRRPTAWLRVFGLAREADWVLARVELRDGPAPDSPATSRSTVDSPGCCRAASPSRFR